MSDEIDLASAQEERSRARQIEAVRRQAMTKLPVSEVCYYCGAPTYGKRFCSPDCRDEWELLQKTKYRGK